MPRANIKPLKSYSYRSELAVRTTDLNYGGHLGNDRLLSLIHEARVAYLASLGFTELSCGGTSLIMADAVISYRGEAFAGDVLSFETAAGEFGRLGFRLFHRVARPADGTLIAVVETGMVSFDYQAGRPAPLTGAARTALGGEPPETSDA